MEKKLKRVQRGAAVGFVVLKILRILPSSPPCCS